MGRQILTFALVFLAIMLLFGPCNRAPPRQGIAVEQPALPGDDAHVLRHPGGAEARISPDGSVASLVADGAEVVRAIPATRRPFHLFLGQTEKRPRSLAGWKEEKVADGGLRFVHVQDGLRVEKTLRFAEDGSALLCDIRAEGVPEEAVGFVLTGASGTELDGADAAPSFAFWHVEGRPPRQHSLQALVQAREQAQGRGYASSENVGPGDKVARFGLLGRHHYLALEGLPAVSELFVDAYRASREGGETDEMETWLDLVARDGRYEGTFALRWAPRAEAPTELREGPGFREARTFTLEDETFRVELTDRGAAIRAMWLKVYSTVAGKPPSPETWIPIVDAAVRDGERALTLALTLHDDRYGEHDVWEAAPAEDGRSIRFTLATPDGWKLWKVLRLPERGRFDLGVEIGVEAPPGAAAGQAVLSLVGPSGGYIVDSYRGITAGGVPEAYVLERSGGSSKTETIDALGKGILERKYSEERRGLFKAVGLRGAYFVCALVSEDPRNAVSLAVAKAIRLAVPVERLDGSASSQSMLGRVSLSLPLEGGRATQLFRLYAGPNETQALRALDMGESIDFGFFGFIGRALMWLMKALQSVVGSYGVAIMLLTVIVRGLLLPVSYRTQLSMQRYGKRVQKIKPLLDEIQKKYAKDPQRMNQERMRVMREHGVGLPLGCLTIFLQIPIWFALFQALRVEFALRHQGFLWVDDLSMPDRLLHLPFWPHWFNLLPIVMLVLWVLQQKLAPTPGSDDPQVQMQMKMMRFMPYVFFLMLYSYAAGLALYMCVSSCWTIAESKLVRRALARLG